MGIQASNVPGPQESEGKRNVGCRPRLSPSSSGSLTTCQASLPPGRTREPRSTPPGCWDHTYRRKPKGTHWDASFLNNSQQEKTHLGAGDHHTREINTAFQRATTTNFCDEWKAHTLPGNFPSPLKYLFQTAGSSLTFLWQIPSGSGSPNPHQTCSSCSEPSSHGILSRSA